MNKKPHPKYLDDVLNIAGSEVIKPGTVNHIEVRHDTWCDLLHRRGPCNCRPDVRLVRPS
ncbi:MAG: hypothetical protein FJ191_08370 [Gammaproteobacteria bacterium]|nr:hypothetical protein [Gammaproteobacteria bacterium]